MPLSHNLRGALFMSLSMAGFTFNDVFMKIVSARMNMGEAMFIRGIFATLFIFALAWSRRALRPVRLAFHPMIILRIIGEAGGTVTFLIGGAYGLDPSVRKAASRTVKLSDAVLNHEVARVVLFEQLYRAVTLLEGIPYHH